MIKWSQKYEKVKKIGQGSSGQIYLVIRRDIHEPMAAKIIKANSDQTQLNSIELQIKIMSTINHPNILKCHGVQLFNDQIWILTQYCEDGSLSDIMRHRKTVYNQNQISGILSQVLEGLEELHHNNIIHRDIKASNLLYHKGTVKIGDFGISIMSQGNIVEPKFSRIGSPFWMSPQILSESIYNSKSDIWALGITAIQLAQSEPPYSHQHPFRAIYSIQTHPPRGLKQQEMWSKEFNNFIEMCLTLDYKARPSASELLNHEFINKKVEFSQNESDSSNFMHDSYQNVEDTMILHDFQPESVWQKGSFPQSEEKKQENQEMYDTVVIKQNAESSSLLLFSDMKQQISGVSAITMEKKLQQNKNCNSESLINSEQRQKKVKELYQLMEEQIKAVRKRYMQKISQLYLLKAHKPWSSPVKKIKEKSFSLLSNEHFRSSSQMFKKML